jgi:hypothetical protein
MERFYYPPAPPTPTDKGCQIKNGNPYAKAGQQVVISGISVYSEGPCTVQVSFQVSYQTTATSSTTQTITNSVGASVSVNGGVDFIADGEVTAQVSTDWSNTIATMSGQDVTHGNSSTITNTVGFKLGTQAPFHSRPLISAGRARWTAEEGRAIRLSSASQTSQGLVE